MGNKTAPDDSKIIRYVALGDSYTICEGASWEESWPVMLTERLSDAGIPIQLAANPARTGWTTRDLIEKELPIFDTSSPSFATLLIGVNDWVQGVTTEDFRKNLNFIIDHILNKLQGTKDKRPGAAPATRPSFSRPLVLITIPDFSATPEGPKYSKERNISEGLKEFNNIILAEALGRNLKCVDIYPVSQEMKGQPELISQDNLHPSAREYAIWEKLIYPVVHAVLK